MTRDRMPENLGFAIIGCGLIGRRRALTLPEASLRYACDLELARASALAAGYPACRATNEPARVWSDPAVDVVLVSVANAALAPLTLAAVRAGKHVLVEKPGAVSSAELKQIAGAAG